MFARLCLIAALLGGPAAGAPEDLSSALARLEASSSRDRRSAERWLAEHLEVADLAPLAEAATGLGLEARMRLATAIGSQDGHFALAALLASEAEPLLRDLGETALLRMIERRWDATELEPTAEPLVREALGGKFSDRLLSMELGRLAFAEEVAAAVRHLGVPEGLPGAGPVAVVLDPGLYASGLKRRDGAETDVVTRSPEQLLFTVLERHGDAVLQGFAMDGPRSWLHVVHRGNLGAGRGGAGRRRGEELILDWCRQVVARAPSGPNPGARAEGAARALAALGWPAALDWLAWRWDQLGDRNALSGLLLSAERGRLSPSLARPDAVVRLLAAADEALRRGRRLDLRFAEEVLRTLGSMGALSDGSDLAGLLAAGLDADGGLSERSQRLRLGALAELRRVPPALAADLRRRLADEALPPELALVMLRTLAQDALASRPFTWRDPAPAFRTELRPVLHRSYDHWLAASGARPPSAWRDPASVGLPSAPGSVGTGGVGSGGGAILRARLVLWWLDDGTDLEVAAAHLLDLTERLGASPGLPEAAAGNVLARFARRGRSGLLERCFERARERAEGSGSISGADAPGAGLDRLALLAGVLDAEAESAVFHRIAPAGVADEDLQLLGALAARADHEVGASAREAFLRYLADGGAREREDPPWVPALDRALSGLRAAAVPRGQRQRAEEEFLFALRGELRGSTHPAAQGLAAGRWPRSAGLESEAVEALEVRLD